MSALLEREIDRTVPQRGESWLPPANENSKPRKDPFAGLSLVDLDSLSKDDILEIARTRGGFQIWETTFTCRKYHAAADESETIGVEPDEVVVKKFNLLMYGGASCLWECLIGNGTATAGQSLTYFNNAQAAIGVGDSSTSPVATQTNLVAATNKLRVAMSSTYPTHTDGVVVGSSTITFQGSFSTGQANYAWNEVALFNSTTDAVGRMLNRLAPGGGFGTKASGTWTMAIAITLS